MDTPTIVDVPRICRLLDQPLTEQQDSDQVTRLWNNAGMTSPVCELITDLQNGTPRGRNLLRSLLDGHMAFRRSLRPITGDDITNARGAVEAAEHQLKQAKDRQHRILAALQVKRESNQILNALPPQEDALAEEPAMPQDAPTADE